MQPAAALGASQWNSIHREGGSPLLATESFQTVCPDQPVVAATLSCPAMQAVNPWEHLCLERNLYFYC